MNNWHPYRHMIDHYPDVVMETRVALPYGVQGQWDGHQLIMLHRNLTLTQAWCVLTHEIIHMERGWVSSTPEREQAEEDEVVELTARRLVSMQDLVAAVHTRGGGRPQCDDMGVTPSVVSSRLASLDRAERVVLGHAVNRYGMIKATRWWTNVSVLSGEQRSEGPEPCSCVVEADVLILPGHNNVRVPDDLSNHMCIHTRF